jgi:predicted secreted protein
MRKIHVYGLILLLVAIQVNGVTTALNAQTERVGVNVRANPFWLLLLQESSWNHSFGGVNNDRGYSILEHSTGGFAIGGYTYSFGEGGADFWLIRTDDEGTPQWNRTYGTSTNNEGCQEIIELTDGGLILTGWRGYPSEPYDAWVIRSDNVGTQLWNQTIGGPANDYLRSVVALSDGGFALAGSTTSYGSGDYDAWLVKLSTNGNPLWNYTFGGAEADRFTSILELSDGFLLSGYTESAGSGNNDVFIVRTDQNGNQQWNQTYGGPLDDHGFDSVLCDDGGFAFGGYTEGNTLGDDDFWLIRTDATGDVQWNKTYGGTSDDNLYSLVICDEGGFALLGTTYSYGAGSSDFWLVRTNQDGDLHWDLTFGGSGGDRGSDLVYTSDDCLVLTGLTSSYGAGGDDIWLVGLEDDPPPTTVQIPGFPLEGLLLGLFGGLGLCLFLRRRRKHPL